MSSDTPGAGRPDGGQGTAPSNQPPAAGEWPAELVPPAETPAAPVPGEPGPAATAWGQPEAPVPAVPASVPPVSTPQPTPPPVAQPAWGAPPAGPPQQQPPAPGYGAPVPPAAAGGQWGAPPPQQPGAWAPPPGAAGGAPAGWQPAPAKSSNGCLKACLIVGIVLVILAVVFFIAITILGMKFASDMGINPDGSMQECSFVTNAELAEVLAGQPVGMPLGGFVDATIGQLLDKRLLAEAEDCWLVQESNGSGGYTGRLAFAAAGDFDAELAAAEAGGFYATDIPGFGDRAFCTGIAETGSTGALVGQGGRLAYVSLIEVDVNGFDFGEAPNGVLYSPTACEQAAAIAAQILR